ncbi:MAG TPA: glutamine-hydrolyzing GMP synthase [Gaiella sp.]|nr:glutamine-hydrolyzing GMP synthase [Gaiella sp.]
MAEPAEVIAFPGPEPAPEERPVLVLDFGGQYSQLIARRVREARVYSELVSHRIAPEEISERNPAALILSGGPASVYADGAPLADPGIFALGVPTLGICYGMQLMARELGGTVEANDVSEYGKADVDLDGSATLFHDLAADQVVWMSHRDSVTAAPTGARVTASSETTPIAAFEDPDRGLYGVQFHPEVVHTPQGQRILEAFLYDVAGAPPAWTPAAVIEEQVERIRAQVGSERVICGLSGGVDSAVAALLVHKAVGDQLTCVFVDHGLLRENEAQQVVETFGHHFHVPLVHVDARERFLARLAGISEPEEKRAIVGEEFIRVFEEEARRLSGAASPESPRPASGRSIAGDVRFLVQGTLYSDVIESGGDVGVAAKIKSHHNVGGLPADMRMELVEPLRSLFKDEVRRVGEQLGLPERMVWRHPFPGPGLAIRIIGDVTEERLAILRAADAILLEEVRRADLYRELWQCFAVLPAVRSVGVQGDERTYAYPVVIRAVTSEDAMTADWARLPYELLDVIASRIVNEVPGVNRVALDLTSKPPATIEWE